MPIIPAVDHHSTEEWCADPATQHSTDQRFSKVRMVLWLFTLPPLLAFVIADMLLVWLLADDIIGKRGANSIVCGMLAGTFAISRIWRRSAA